MQTTSRLGKHHRGFTLIELMVVLAIMGVLASVAIPTFTLYMRRVKTGEARIQLAKLFDSANAFFYNESVVRGEVQVVSSGGQFADTSGHRCPHPVGSPGGGAAGITPSFATDCNAGNGSRCTPAVGGTGGGVYELAEWDENAVWSGLAFRMEQSHFFRYNFVATNTTTGYGRCQFTSQAFADLDDDDTFSTFERSGAADEQGVNGAAGLFIRLPVE